MKKTKTLKRKILRFLFPQYYLKKIYLKKTGKELNLKKTITFNEKIQWLKLYDYPKNNLIIHSADKSLLPDYLKSLGLAHYAVSLLGVWDSFDHIPLGSMPEKFVLKINNSSSRNIFINDKQHNDWQEIKEKLDYWLTEDYGLINLERHYSKIRPKIIAEEYLDLSEDLLEYNFYCFHGNIRFCRVIRFDDKITKTQKATCYSPNWEKLNFQSKESELPNTIECPDNLQDMLDACKIISKDFIFVRIDFLKCKEGVILGELTFSPSAGYNTTFTSKAQEIMGSWIDLSKSKSFKKRFNS